MHTYSHLFTVDYCTVHFLSLLSQDRKTCPRHCGNVLGRGLQADGREARAPHIPLCAQRRLQGVLMLCDPEKSWVLSADLLSVVDRVRIHESKHCVHNEDSCSNCHWIEYLTSRRILSNSHCSFSPTFSTASLSCTAYRADSRPRPSASSSCGAAATWCAPLIARIMNYYAHVPFLFRSDFINGPVCVNGRFTA